MSTSSHVYFSFDNDPIAEFCEQVNKKKQFESYICFGSISYPYRKGKGFVFGFGFSDKRMPVVEKFVNDFNKLFNNIQLKIHGTVPVHRTGDSFEVKFNTEGRGNISRKITFIEILFSEGYSEWVKYCLYPIIGELIRPLSNKHDLILFPWEDPEINTFEFSWEYDQSKVSGGYSCIRFTCPFDYIKTFDNPELINSILSEPTEPHKSIGCKRTGRIVNYNWRNLVYPTTSLSLIADYYKSNKENN